MIDVDRRLKGLDRLRRLLQDDEALSALLMEATEMRMIAFQPDERRECVGDAAKAALRDGEEQLQISLAGLLGQQRRAGLQRFGELLLS